MSKDERDAAVAAVAADPRAGDLMPGTGGCRKLRIAGRGRGKSGGYRVITYWAGSALPVFLLTVFGKGDRANLTRAECNTLATITGRLATAYRRGGGS